MPSNDTENIYSSPTMNTGVILTTPAVTVESDLTDVPTSGRKYSVLYELIKRIYNL